MVYRGGSEPYSDDRGAGRGRGRGNNPRWREGICLVFSCLYLSLLSILCNLRENF